MSIRVKKGLLLWLACFPLFAIAQYAPPLYLKSTVDSNRAKSHQKIIENIIVRGLSEPLNEETEDSWMYAFNSMEVLNYRDAFTWQKVQEAIENMAFQSPSFQRSVLEVAWTAYPDDFVHEIESLIKNTTDPELFAISALYLLRASPDYRQLILKQLTGTFADSVRTAPLLTQLLNEMQPQEKTPARSAEIMKVLLSAGFIPGQTILYSFQRKDRNYPGLAIVRGKDGRFVQADNDEVFHVQQLARGISNLPFYIKRGNTPQGIFSMYGFGVSRNQSIGPTANLQMGMPVELSIGKFFHQNPSVKRAWSINDYAAMLPLSIRDYQPLFESYYAGSAGRREIIAHGSTVNPDYYRKTTFYPLTPTDGCLCTSEEWNGKLIASDQQRLVNALIAAGGANGFVVVMDIDDRQEPVTLNDVKDYLPR